MPQFLTQAGHLPLSNRIARSVAVIGMSKANWLVAALVPGFKRQPLKKIDADAQSFLKLMQRWRDQAVIRRSKMRTRGGRTASDRPWPVIRRGSSATSRRFSPTSASTASA